MTIISILTAFALCHFIRELGKLRRYEWLTAYIGQCGRQLEKLPGGNGGFGFLIIIATPLVVLGLVNYLSVFLFGDLGGFLLALLVLIYTFGPRDLDTDVKAILQAEDGDTQDEALSRILGGTVPEDEDTCRHRAIESVFSEALKRWFGIIFWFAVLGVYGALLYRMATWLADGDTELNDNHAALVSRLQQVLDWPVAQLMTLSLAIATDFDSVFAAWKQYHNEQGHGLFDGNNGFLLVSARQVVLSGSAARDGYADQLTGPLTALQLAMDLVWRILAVWLFVLALLLLVDVIK